MNSLTLNAHLQRLHKNQSPSTSVGATFISFSIWTFLFICMGFQLSQSAPYWVTSLKDLLNKKNKQAHVMPGSITNTSCDIDLRLNVVLGGRVLSITLAPLHHIQTTDTNRELFLEHKCVCFYWISFFIATSEILSERLQGCLFTFVSI